MEKVNIKEFREQFADNLNKSAMVQNVFGPIRPEDIWKIHKAVNYRIFNFLYDVFPSILTFKKLFSFVSFDEKSVMIKSDEKRRIKKFQYPPLPVSKDYYFRPKNLGLTRWYRELIGLPFPYPGLPKKIYDPKKDH